MNDTEIPADLVFLSSSDAGDICYVETANLDGVWVLPVVLTRTVRTRRVYGAANARRRWWQRRVQRCHEEHTSDHMERTCRRDQPEDQELLFQDCGKAPGGRAQGVCGGQRDPVSRRPRPGPLPLGGQQVSVSDSCRSGLALCGPGILPAQCHDAVSVAALAGASCPTRTCTGSRAR